MRRFRGPYPYTCSDVQHFAYPETRWVPFAVTRAMLWRRFIDDEIELGYRVAVWIDGETEGGIYATFGVMRWVA